MVQTRHPFKTYNDFDTQHNFNVLAQLISLGFEIHNYFSLNYPTRCSSFHGRCNEHFLSKYTYTICNYSTQPGRKKENQKMSWLNEKQKDYYVMESRSEKTL